MYNKSNYDHIFYRMKKTIPKSSILYVIITVIKLYPLFFLSHSAGYMNPKKDFYAIHSYYKFFTLSYYLGTMPSSSIIAISIAILILNLIIICLFIMYLLISKKVQQIDQNYGDISSLGVLFYIFSNLAFFKYIILFQFFNEVNFFPIVCIGKISEGSINVNAIFSESYKQTLTDLCNGGNKIMFYGISLLNILIDIALNWILTSRFFDLNILSDYVWNFTPKYILSFGFLESFSQIFFNIFLFFDNKIFLISYSTYVGVIFLLNLFEKTQSNFFTTPKNYNLVVIRDFIAHLSYIGTAFILLFMIINDSYPNDLSIVILLIIEVVISLMIHKLQHRNDDDLVKLDYGTIRKETIRDVRDLKGLSYDELASKIAHKDSFALAIYNDSCTCWSNFSPILTDFINETNINVEHMDVDELVDRDNDFGLHKVKADLPGLALFSRGKLVRQALYLQVDNKPIFTQYKKLKEFFENNTIAPKMYYVEKEVLDEKIANGEEFNLYIARKECPDCQNANYNVLYSYSDSLTTVNENLYIFDIQEYYANTTAKNADGSRKYSDEQVQYYQEIKDTYGLSTVNNPILGFGTGSVPTFQRRKGNEISDMVVVFNDYPNKENNTIASYFTEARIEKMPFLKDTTLEVNLDGKSISGEQISDWGSYKYTYEETYHYPILKLFLQTYVK